MNFTDYLYLAALVAAAFGAAFAALCAFSHFDRRKDRKITLFTAQGDEKIVFLFDDERLVNATADARGIIATAPRVGSDWSRFLAVLLPRFPSLRTDIANLADEERMKFDSVDGSAVLIAEWKHGLARLTLVDEEGDDAPIGMDQHSFAAMEHELATLRATAEHTPYPVWREASDGTITWANAAYLALADKVAGPDIGAAAWPPARLFDTASLKGARGMRRKSLTIAGESENPLTLWFECGSSRIGDEHLFTAIHADGVVQAEKELRDFIQTLTKTFAHLPIGLAIFDKSRQLVLFNPALADLTSLTPEFLLQRPTLANFLDRLRDGHMIPEPKNYKSWRQQIAALEAAAADGSYEETWHLPTGQIYRVTGRPHPDGAVALMLEDISSEISLTRRFRADLETSQAVLDSLEEAVAVLSSDGILTTTNAAYDRLWSIDPTETSRPVTVLDATKAWHAKCAPTPLWGELRDFVGAIGERAEWSGETRLWDGRRLACRFLPLSGGKTMVTFTVQENIAHRFLPRLEPADKTALDA